MSSLSSPVGVLECTINNFSGLGAGLVTSTEKLELLDRSVVFDLRNCKRKAKGDEPASFSLYLGCTPKGSGQGRQVVWEKQYAVESRLQIINVDGVPKLESTVERDIYCKEEPSWGRFCLADLQTLLDPANKYVVNNQLKVAAKIFSIAPSKVSSQELKEIEGKVHVHPSPTSILETFLESEIGSDVVFISKDEGKVKAHSGILIAASSVFKAMFEAPMEETKCREVRLDDMTTAQSVRTFLKCVYTGSFFELYWVKLAVLKEIINAAEKYQMSGLKQGAGVFLLDHVCPRNAVHLLHFAKRYGLEETEKSVREYIRGQLNSVLDNTIAEDPDADAE